MIFGKHINKYYLRYAPMLILGILSLVLVDYMQLVVPELYRMVINGIEKGTVDGAVFDMEFLLDKICLPMIYVIVAMVIGRFLWRICFFGAGVKVETDIRSRMFDRCKDLSQQYYQVNKVGNMMSFFTNDLETVQECFGWGIMMFFDALLLGVLAIGKMANALGVSPTWVLGYDVTIDGKEPAHIDLDKLNEINKAKIAAYYQALLDSQEDKA